MDTWQLIIAIDGPMWIRTWPWPMIWLVDFVNRNFGRS
jgi:hypothetical protein